VTEADDQVLYLSVEDLVDIAAIVTGAAAQVRDYGLLSSSAARPGTVAFGVVAYPDLFEKAAALLHSVCMNHALIDGNKRLAWAAAMVMLDINGYPVPDIDVDDAEAFVMSVARGTLAEVPEIAAQLRAFYPTA
jgi:death-on-curing protein